VGLLPTGALRNAGWTGAFLAPAFTIFAAFFLVPLGRLFAVGSAGPSGWAAYQEVLYDTRYLQSFFSTLVLAGSVTLCTICLCAVCGVYLSRARFAFKPLLTAILTLPLAFPGVVVGFLVIMLGGRQGVIAQVGQALGGNPGNAAVFAYSMTGLFVGYLYFSIPRSILTVMATADKLDRDLEEAARTLGASAFEVARDVILPGIRPALVASGAICFATAMGAFGTAFTLATKINVLPMVIYSEFTLQANLAIAAVLSLWLGLLTWLVLILARSATGTAVAAAA
jgi:putative spermidine/putrescine transport system permease protein